MLTISKLAKQFEISRTTLLYYEKEGLLLPKVRGDNGYRWYGDAEVSRLRNIVAYRAYGLPINTIKSLLSNEESSNQYGLLKTHFNQLAVQIQQLRAQQKAIINVLQEPELLANNKVTKQEWVEIMQISGFDEAGMTKWHQTFEQLQPEKHLAFLKSLGISRDEIKRIRAL